MPLLKAARHDGIISSLAWYLAGKRASLARYAVDSFLNTNFLTRDNSLVTV
jgi:hypothetical protein